MNENGRTENSALRGPEQDALRNPARLFRTSKSTTRGTGTYPTGFATVCGTSPTAAAGQCWCVPPQGAWRNSRSSWGWWSIIIGLASGTGDVRPDGIARRIRRGGIQDSTLGKPHREQLGRGTNAMRLAAEKIAGNLCGCTADTVRCGPGRTPPSEREIKVDDVTLPLRARKESGTGTASR